MMHIGLAILNLNEEEGIRDIVPQIPRGAIEETFAVDGGSVDDSPRLLDNFGIDVISQAAAGRGEAFRLAVEHARQKSLDAIIFFSPDGNEDPADITRFRTFLEDGYEIVIASRMMQGATNEEDSHWFRPRKWANLVFDALAHLTWGRGQEKITDAINGFRAMTVAAWDELALDAEGFAIEYQISIRAYKRGMRVKEFPTTEGRRIGGESTAKSLPTGLRFLKLYWSELTGRSDF